MATLKLKKGITPAQKKATEKKIGQVKNGIVKAVAPKTKPKARKAARKSARKIAKAVLTGKGKNRFAIVIWMTTADKRTLAARAKKAGVSVVEHCRRKLGVKA